MTLVQNGCNQRPGQWWLILIGGVVGLFLTSCAALEQARWQEPEVRLLSTELVRLTPTNAYLETRFEVTNPNAFGVSLGALDYDVVVNGARVLGGEQSEGQRLSAGGDTEVLLPVALSFQELASLISDFSSRDEIDYAVSGGMTFDIPVAGAVRVPADASGSVPIPRMPTIEVTGLRTDRIGISGADAVLGLRINNPNLFGLVIDRFSYEFALDNRRVAGGDSQQRVRLDEQSSGLVEIPLSVSFIDTGTSLYNAVVNNQPVSYGLSFESELATSLPQMAAFPFSAVQDGNIQFGD